MPWIAIGIFLAIFLVPSLLSGDQGDEITYTEFIALVDAGDVNSIEVENGSLKITGELRDGSKFQTTGGGDSGLISNDVDDIRSKGVKIDFKSPSSNWFLSIIGLLLPVMLIIGFFVWLQRRAQGQMGNVMSIGRSRAKAYDTDQPSTTFADIAGYEGVKQEINEVVDFLRMPERFREIGATGAQGHPAGRSSRHRQDALRSRRRR